MDVVVVGGGVIGSAAARALARAGERVTLLEARRVGNDQGSSHGPSRVIRLAYDGADYVALARAAYAAWDELAATVGETLRVQTGGLDVGVPEAREMAGIAATYAETGVPWERLDRDEIVRRYPMFNPPEGSIGLWQPDYALLAADRCVQALAADARAHGATLREGTTVRAVAADGAGVAVTTDEGTLRADAAVVAAGSWLGPLVAPLGVDLPLTVRQEQFAHFRPADPAACVPGRMPLVLNRFPGTRTLGAFFPMLADEGVKVIVDRVGPVVAPENPSRAIDPDLLARNVAYAHAFMPSLGEVVQTVSCRYTLTPSEDFILDTLPGAPQVVVAAACSGHGFKFAPVIGEILAGLATGRPSALPGERFRLANFV